MIRVLSQEGANERVDKFLLSKLQVRSVVARAPNELLIPGKDRDNLIERTLVAIEKLNAYLEKLFNLATAEREVVALAFEIKLLHKAKSTFQNNRNDTVEICKAFAQVAAISAALSRVYDALAIEEV